MTRSIRSLARLASSTIPNPSRQIHTIIRPAASTTTTTTTIASSSSTSTQSRSNILIGPFGHTKRGIHSTIPRQHGEVTRPAPGTGIKITFQDSKGNDVKTIEGNEGDDLLSLAHEYDVDLEGACEGSVACSTCHVIISPEHYDLLPEPDDEENDMLDLAFGLEDTSRLGCQVKLSKELDGMVAKLPSATRNMYVDGAKARTH
ncbi:hypothetical protein CI109_103837 [Kwoniella shandongensis]|uniref:Uncharacterized protein n=1 Tax=Kwoniella shandongensis TaxID=1734106 RepID=A0A5M6C6Z9_9TREE|nr:uncharacterized protein CI109_000467 [Kwoniella shandongensis]KAA5530897.1 hypothetical protein CI109_000467 [Kwoniella shandongensis]